MMIKKGQIIIFTGEDFGYYGLDLCVRVLRDFDEDEEWREIGKCSSSRDYNTIYATHLLNKGLVEPLDGQVIEHHVSGNNRTLRIMCQACEGHKKLIYQRQKQNFYRCTVCENIWVEDR